jgi:glycosyltransferase involved in cell wall biosynthesis
VGAARLEVHHRQHIRLADSPRDFADACLDLLAGEELRKRQAATVWEMVASNFSWEHVARCFERAIESQRAW